MGDCTHFEELIGAELDGELSEDERQALHAHVAECENCRRYREALQSISGVLAEDMKEAPVELAENVMAQIRGKTAQTKKKGRIIPFRTWGMVAAAAIVVIVGLQTVGPGRAKDAQTAGEVEAPMAKMAMAAPMAPAAAEPEAAMEMAEAEEAPAERMLFAADADAGNGAGTVYALVDEDWQLRVPTDEEVRFLLDAVLLSDGEAEAPGGEFSYRFLVTEDGDDTQTYLLFVEEDAVLWQIEGEDTVYRSPVTPEEFVERMK